MATGAVAADAGADLQPVVVRVRYVAGQISIQVTQLRRTGKQGLKQKSNRLVLTMVWKIVLLSISIVIGSFIIGAAIVAAQVLSVNANNTVDFGDIEGFGNARRGTDATIIPANATTVVRIVADAGSDSYDPNPVEVNVGETVTWQNSDATIHTASSNDDTFDSKILRSGEVFSFTFEEEGEFPYYCKIHPSMKGTVVVS